MEKLDSVQEKMGNVGRKIKVLRKNQEKMLENENTVREMKNVFDGLIKG